MKAWRAVAKGAWSCLEGSSVVACLLQGILWFFWCSDLTLPRLYSLIQMLFVTCYFMLCPAGRLPQT
jgi:hypothetical protein